MGEKKQAAVSNEEVVAAILASGTIGEAARACGIAPRTIYDRMKDGDFKAEYAAARAEIVRAAVSGLNAHLLAAIETVAEIMADRNNSPAVRLQAAQAILNHAGKLSDRLDATEKAYKRASETSADRLAESLEQILF